MVKKYKKSSGRGNLNPCHTVGFFQNMPEKIEQHPV